MTLAVMACSPVIMDRGIDYTHPDFINPDGSTRIAYIYDLFDDTGANDPDNPYGIGTIYDSQEINNSLENGGALLTNDIFGHGTATSGIFAGNGSAIADETLYRGVAYEATIISIIVSKDYVPPFGGNPGQPGQFNPNLLPTGFQFAQDKIEELDMPAVTLLNIGSIGQPTDGSIALCDVVDNYVAAGNIFVCGVGDDGGAANHALTTLVEGQTTEIQILKGNAGNLRFTAWYPEDERFNLTIERPSGIIEGPFPPPSGPNEAVDNFVDQINIFHRGANVEFENSSADIRELLIDFSGATGTYIIRMETTEVNAGGTLHAYLNPSRYNNDNRFLNHISEGGSINAYSSCLTTFSPTDYVATSTWTDIDGIERMRINEGDPGEIWAGSSAGPTMDGRIGTDIAAPGEIAAAAYSLDSYYGSFSFNVLENSDGYYGIQTAVSAASPLTAGVIALMLEADPDLTPLDIANILRESAREDSFTGATPNFTWGHGKLDALAALNIVYGVNSTSDGAGTVYPVEIFPNPARESVTVMLPEDFPKVQAVTLYNSVGIPIRIMRPSELPEIQLEGTAAGSYFISLQTEEGIFNYRLLKL